MEEIGIAVKAQKQIEDIVATADALDKVEKTTEQLNKTFQKMSEESKKNVKGLSDEIKDFEKQHGKLEGVDMASPAISKLDTSIRKVIDDVRRLAKEGSKELQQIQTEFEAIKGKGKDATEAEIKAVKKLIEEYQILSRQKITDTQMIEKEAQVSIRNRLKVGDLEPNQELLLKRLQEQLSGGQISRTEQARVDMMRSRLDYTEQDPGADDGGTSKWGSRMQKVGAFVLGGSLVGFALQSIRHWAEVDKQLVQVEQRFRNVRGEIEGMGEGLGYTRSESAELAKIWGEIQNKFSGADVRQYLGFSRFHGIDPAQTMQLKLAGRYARQAGAGTELTRFETFSEQMGMGQGRMGELINVQTQLARLASEQMLNTSMGDVRNVQLFARRLWQDTEPERGMGQWGAGFIQRLNAGMSQTGGDPQKAFLLRAYGFGSVPGQTLSETMQRIEAGAFGEGNIQDVMKRLRAEIPGNEEWQIQGMKGLFPQLGYKDIRQLAQAWDDPVKRDSLIKTLEKKESKTSEDFEKLGSAAVSLGDEFKRLMDSVRYNLAQSQFVDANKKLKENFDTSINEFVGSISKATNKINAAVDLINLTMPKMTPFQFMDSLEGAAKGIVNFFSQDHSQENELNNKPHIRGGR